MQLITIPECQDDDVAAGPLQEPARVQKLFQFDRVRATVAVRPPACLVRALWCGCREQSRERPGKGLIEARRADWCGRIIHLLDSWIAASNPGVGPCSSRPSSPHTAASCSGRIPSPSSRIAQRPGRERLQPHTSVAVSRRWRRGSTRETGGSRIVEYRRRSDGRVEERRGGRVFGRC